jgi:hypothetical protein
MFKDLLKPNYGVDDSPEDNTRITQVILYLDEPDAKELKRLAKEAMKKLWPNSYDKEGNISILYLELLKRFNDEGYTLFATGGVEERSIEPKSTEDNGTPLFF